MATQREKHTGSVAVEEPPEQRSASERTAIDRGAPGTSRDERGTGMAATGNSPTTRGTALSPTAMGIPTFFGSAMALPPFALLRRVNEDFNQLFEALMRSGTTTGLPAAAESGMSAGTAGRYGATAGWAPHIEIQQRRGALLVRADLAGVNPDDIEVTVENGVLAISGERRQERREEREGVVHTELSYGSFFRTVPLPDGADENRISAILRNGTLEITVPVAARERGRRVQVQQS